MSVRSASPVMTANVTTSEYPVEETGKRPEDFHLDTEEGLKEVYGEWFCSTIGIQNLLAMPTVSAESLNLQYRVKYHEGATLVEHMKEHSLVKFFDGGMRPGIALRMKGYDYENETMFKCVEIIHKRYSVNGDGEKGGLHEHNYVTSLSVRGDDMRVRESSFYHSGATYDWDKMQAFLNGEPITTTLNGTIHGNRVAFIQKV